MTTSEYTIAAVERDTGLGKDTLRAWERRYGFPTPGRDEHGERSYTQDQVDRLRLIKRLLDHGHRPGKVVTQPVDDLQRLLQQRSALAQAEPGDAVDETEIAACVDAIERHDVDTLRRTMARSIGLRGLAGFVTGVAAPLTSRVGEAWLAGRLQVFEEHLYTEALSSVLRSAIAQLPDAPAQGRPRVLLTTFPGEPHALGLLMVESLFTLEGCRCVSLGVQTPLSDIVAAAQRCQADVLALSFTPVIAARLVSDGLVDLRRRLDAGIEIWAGGSAPVLDAQTFDGVTRVPTLADAAERVRRWRETVPA